MKQGALPVKIVARTDTGRVREANEDSFTVVDDPAPALLESHGRLLVVADGMGGALGGETASSMVTNIVRDHYYASAGDISAALEAAVLAANAAVHQLASDRPDLRGMGSTCTAVVIRDQRLWYAHVGDSRCYLVRDHRVLQLTNDHSKVAQMLRDGLLSEEEAAVHPERNVILRSIGPKPAVEVEVIETSMPLHDGDHLVLCSDGLSGPVEDREILQIVDQDDPDEAAEKLIALANIRGGEDNITVQIARIGARPKFDDPARPPDETLVEEPLSAEPSPVVASREQTERKNLRVLVIISVCCCIVGATTAALVLGGSGQGDDGEEADAGPAPAPVFPPVRPPQGAVAPRGKPAPGPAIVKAGRDAGPSAAPDASWAPPPGPGEPDDPPSGAVILTHKQRATALRQTISQHGRCPHFLSRVAAELRFPGPLPGVTDLDVDLKLIPLVRAIAQYQRDVARVSPDGIAGARTQKRLLREVVCEDRPARKR